MRRPLFAAVWILLAAAATTTAVAQSGDQGKGGIRDRLVGSWRLLGVEEQEPDGTMRRDSNRRGTIVYTRDGHMSVQIMLPQGEDVPGNKSGEVRSGWL